MLHRSADVARGPSSRVPDRRPASPESVLGEIRPALMMLLALSVITGVLYPLAITGIAQAVFPRQANGSLIVRDGNVVGSSWIGQPFSAPRYFWGRLSATTPAYNAGSSSGSNLGPLNPALLDAAKARIEALRAADPEAKLPVPVDLVTASGSGLDPHISVAAAEYQVNRVARARGLARETVRRLVAAHTTGRWLQLVGEPVVNVLELNLALDAQQ
jgi:K+-transporting ATPase ATPase C chain